MIYNEQQSFQDGEIISISESNGNRKIADFLKANEIVRNILNFTGEELFHDKITFDVLCKLLSGEILYSELAYKIVKDEEEMYYKKVALLNYTKDQIEYYNSGMYEHILVDTDCGNENLDFTLNSLQESLCDNFDAYIKERLNLIDSKDSCNYKKVIENKFINLVDCINSICSNSEQVDLIDTPVKKLLYVITLGSANESLPVASKFTSDKDTIYSINSTSCSEGLCVLACILGKDYSSLDISKRLLCIEEDLNNIVYKHNYDFIKNVTVDNFEPIINDLNITSVVYKNNKISIHDCLEGIYTNLSIAIDK